MFLVLFKMFRGIDERVNFVKMLFAWLRYVWHILILIMYFSMNNHFLLQKFDKSYKCAKIVEMPKVNWPC